MRRGHGRAADLVRAPREGRSRSSLSLLASTPSSVHTQFSASLGAEGDCIKGPEISNGRLKVGAALRASGLLQSPGP